MADWDMSLIVCLGNRLFESDAAGPLVYDRLAAGAASLGIQVVDGGTAGLNLLPMLRGRQRIVFVDAVAGFGSPGEVVIVGAEQLKTLPLEHHYGHDAGLLYLLRILAPLLPEQNSAFCLVGLEGEPTAAAIAKAARLAIDLASGEMDIPHATPHLATAE